jgi:microcystin-dependent protein
MSSLLPTPEPADPVEGEPGHFEHTNWVKAALKALDRGLLRKPAGSTPAGKLLGTTSENTWEPVDPAAIGSVPRGVIVAYNGDTSPTGWAICNGSNGTPDLRDRFIVGVSATKARGTRAGVESVKLTSAQSGSPAHTHTTDSKDAAHSHEVNTIKLDHGHTGYTYHPSGPAHDGWHSHGGGGHSHPLWALQDVALGSPNARRITGGSQGSAGGSWDGTGGGDHSHDNGAHGHHIGINGYVGSLTGITTKPANATHSHGVNANAAADASQAHDNMPPYYALVYIMKL